MRRVVLVILGLVSVAGCARVKVSRVMGPDGRPAYSLSCARPTQCHERAGEVCRSGYDVHDSSSEVGTVPLQATPTVYSRQTMLITCRERG